MIATEPLPPSVWDEIGWAGRETLADGRHLIIYAQRTADDRIAFGGRGAPYHFGSRIRDDFDRDRRVFADLRSVLVELFPSVAGARDHPRVGRTARRPPGLVLVGRLRPRRPASAGPAATSATASSTTNLAGRTLADLLLGVDSELTALPWVNHRSPTVGAGAAAVARDQRRPPPPHRRRPPRGAHRARVPLARAPARQARRLTSLRRLRSRPAASSQARRERRSGASGASVERTRIVR